METQVEIINQSISTGIALLSFVMLLMALGISTVRTVRQMIPLYKNQSYLLALVTLLTALNPTIGQGELVLKHRIVLPFLAIPIILALSIEPLLALATISEDMPAQVRWPLIRDRLLDRFARRRVQESALPTWLEHRLPRRSEWLSMPTSLIFIIVAFGIAFTVVGVIPRGGPNDIAPAVSQTETLSRATSLGISLALILIGLNTMIDKQDIIAQIMGLLVMEHGLFLASVQVVASPQVTLFFVVSLFLYTIITLIILVILLPELHNVSKSIQVDDQQELKG